MATIDDTVGKLARVYDSATDTWIPLVGSPVPHVHNLSTSPDVDITEPLADNEILQYSTSASAFVNTDSPTFDVATIDTANIDSVNVTTINASEISVTGLMTVEEITERVDILTLVSNSASPSFDDGNIFYIETAPTDNFSLNIQNVPTTNNKIITFSFITVQGSTGYIPSTFLIAGASQTIKWSGGSAPVATNGVGKIDIFNFTLIRISSSWTVLGNANLNF
jgi:hypothetical protein